MRAAWCGGDAHEVQREVEANVDRDNDEIEEKLDALASFSKFPPPIIAKFFSQRDIYGVELI